MWSIPRMWKDGECWIIGGGPSLHNQFGIPSEMIRPGMELSVLSPYFRPIHDRHVIGVNVAFTLGDWVSVAYFGDRGFFERDNYRYRNALTKFANLKIRHANLSVYHKDWYRDIKQVDFDLRTFGICTDPGKIYWNYSSGAAAINIAAHFGVKRIYLLGYDMKPQGGETHWHNGYGDQRITDVQFRKFLKPWEAIARDAKKLGIEILNVNPDSAIEEFPKVNLNQVL